MTSPELIEHLERAVHDALARWPAQWTGFHWPGYTYHHTLRVRRLARRLADHEGADLAVVDLAALLHDIEKPAGQGHASASAERARRLLDGRLPSPTVEAVASAVGAHNAAQRGDPVEWRVLSDADKIDANFGLVAVTRYFTIRGSRGHSLEEALADIPAWEDRHLELLERLTTAAGRRWADRRLVVMHRFCRELASDRVARAIARFFLRDNAQPDLMRQADHLATQDIPGASSAETRPFAVRLRREMHAEL